MSEQLSIEELARQVSISAQTARHLKDVGILPPAQRLPTVAASPSREMWADSAVHGARAP